MPAPVERPGGRPPLAPWPGSSDAADVQPGRAASAIIVSSMPDEPENVKMAKSTRSVRLQHLLHDLQLGRVPRGEQHLDRYAREVERLRHVAVHRRAELLPHADPVELGRRTRGRPAVVEDDDVVEVVVACR